MNRRDSCGTKDFLTKVGNLDLCERCAQKFAQELKNRPLTGTT